jgi:hypothetical protein
MNLNRLVYFAAVVDTGSFTRAAGRLGITKTVVSQLRKPLGPRRAAVALEVTADPSEAGASSVRGGLVIPSSRPKTVTYSGWVRSSSE